MSKITAYKCDNCDFITPYKDEVFILNGTIANGENELIIECSNNTMLCFECFTQQTGLLTISEELELNSKDTENIRELLSSHTSYGPLNEDEDENELIEDTIPKKIFEKLEESKIENNSKDSNEEIKEDYIEEELESENIEEYMEKKFNNSEDQSLIESPIEESDESQNSDYAYILLKTVSDDDDEKKLLNQLNFNSKEEFQEKTKIETLMGLYVPTSTTITDEVFEKEKINDSHNMSIVPILYNIVDGKPLIKKATILLSEDKQSGYISNEALQLLVG
ncbi:MAG: hypothetical protein ACOC33_01870 [bacterium]